MLEALSRLEAENNIDLDQMCLRTPFPDEILDFKTLYLYTKKEKDAGFIDCALFVYNQYLVTKEKLNQPANSYMEFEGTDEEISNQLSQFMSQEDAKILHSFFMSSTYYVKTEVKLI